MKKGVEFIFVCANTKLPSLSDSFFRLCIQDDDDDDGKFRVLRYEKGKGASFDEFLELLDQINEMKRMEIQRPFFCHCVTSELTLLIFHRKLSDFL